MKIDKTKTNAFYHSLTEKSLCGCDYCRSYRSQVRSAYPQVAAYLETFGIDIEKPYETSPLEPDENGMLEYCCCQYIALGRCTSDFHHMIGDVELRLAAFYPRPKIAEDYFVIEMFPVRLKYIPSV